MTEAARNAVAIIQGVLAPLDQMDRVAVICAVGGFIDEELMRRIMAAHDAIESALHKAPEDPSRHYCLVQAEAILSGKVKV